MEKVPVKKVPVSFNKNMLEAIDNRWKQLGFRGRSEYINVLIRMDLGEFNKIGKGEQNG